MTAGAYDPVEDMLKVKSVQRKWRDSFTGSDLNPGKWTSEIGPGASIAVGGGVLTMASGTAAGAETWILSTETFTVPFRLSIGLTLSQRIANQGFFVECISVDRTSLLPDGLHMLGLLFDATNAAQAKYEVQNGGLARLASGASAFPSTAANGVYEIEPFADEAWFHGGTLDATTGRANSYRRHQQIPDPNALYKVRLRWLNGATPPAGSTNAVVQFLAVQDYAELTAEITAGRGQSVAGQSVAVNVVSPPTVTPVGGQARNAAGALPVLAATGYSANPTAVTTARGVDLLATLIGALVTRPYSIPEADWQYAGAAGGITGTADVVLRAAAAAGIRNYVTSIDVRNAHATVATEVVIKDGATVIWRQLLPAAMAAPVEIIFPTPLRGTAATAVNVACLTTGAQVYVNAQGYAAP
jgi:hypothetical protein